MTIAPPNLSKERLRAAALARRAALSDMRREAASRALAGQGDRVAITPGMVVAGYWPMRGEIDPRPLMRALAARGARLALPEVVARDAPLVFRAWRDGDALVAGPHGTRHPPATAREIVPDIVLVPLAAFDLQIALVYGVFNGVFAARTGRLLRLAKTRTSAPEDFITA